MVIQRWQSLFLFIAVVLMGIFSVSTLATITSPTGAYTEVAFQAYDEWGYFLLNIVTTILVLLSIFLFKQTSVQRTIVLVSMLLMVISAVCGLWIFFDLMGQNQGETVKLSLSGILLCCSFVLCLLAYIFISKDEKLLRSYDRIR